MHNSKITRVLCYFMKVYFFQIWKKVLAIFGIQSGIQFKHSTQLINFQRLTHLYCQLF